MESNSPICDKNLLTDFCMVEDFSGGNSQTVCNFNFNINVSFDVTWYGYMNSSFSFSFSHLLKDLLAFRIMKLESTSKGLTQFENTSMFAFFLIIILYILKNKSGMRLRYFLIAFACIYSLTGLSSARWTFIKFQSNSLLLYIYIYIFSFYIYIYICDELVSFHFSHLWRFYTISKFKRINKKYFHRILLVISGDISLNPGPVYNNQSSCSDEWNVFKAKRIHLIHLNVNIFPKFDETRYIASCLSESQLDETIFHSEIQIFNYELLRCDRNRNGGGLAWCIRSDISCLQKHFFPNEIENIFVEILSPKIEPLIVGVFYRLLIKATFLKFNKLDTDIKESCILDDFNVNMYQNNKYIVRDDNTISSKFLSSDVKSLHSFHQFWTMHSLKQLIKSPTWVTCST